MTYVLFATPIVGTLLLVIGALALRRIIPLKRIEDKNENTPDDVVLAASTASKNSSVSLGLVSVGHAVMPSISLMEAAAERYKTVSGDISKQTMVRIRDSQTGHSLLVKPISNFKFGRHAKGRGIIGIELLHSKDNEKSAV